MLLSLKKLFQPYVKKTNIIFNNMHLNKYKNSIPEMPCFNYDKCTGVLHEF